MKKTMTIFVVLAIVCVTSLSASADVYVRGYFRSNGTYVQPHYRSNPDGNFYNNWSTYPNVNPHTGAIGTRRTPSYSAASTHYFLKYESPSLNYNSRITSPITTLPSYGTRGSSLSTLGSGYSLGSNPKLGSPFTPLGGSQGSSLSSLNW